MSFRELITDTQKLKLPIVADKDVTDPDNAREDGTAYIVGPSAVEEWAGKDGQIAFFDQEWRFITPEEGWQVVVADENAVYSYLGTGWELTSGNPAVNITADTTLTKIKHEGRTLTVNKADGAAITLPDATGSGDEYEFYIGTTITSNSTTIKAANASDTMLGGVVAQDTDAAGTLKAWSVAANDDTITLNGVATGGKAGDVIRVKDVANNLWLVEGYIKQSGGSEATPFSATVS